MNVTSSAFTVSSYIDGEPESLYAVIECAFCVQVILAHGKAFIVFLFQSPEFQ